MVAEELPRSGQGRGILKLKSTTMLVIVAIFTEVSNSTTRRRIVPLRKAAAERCKKKHVYGK